MDGIVGDAYIEPDKFNISSEFDINNHLSYAWRNAWEKLEAVTLRFPKTISHYITQTSHYPGQKLELKEDGSVVLTIKVNISQLFLSWILGWSCPHTTVRYSVAREYLQLAILLSFINVSTDKKFLLFKRTTNILADITKA